MNRSDMWRKISRGLKAEGLEPQEICKAMKTMKKFLCWEGAPTLQAAHEDLDPFLALDERILELLVAWAVQQRQKAVVFGNHIWMCWISGIATLTNYFLL